MSRPFAYNPSRTPISGTDQVGDLAIGLTSQDYSAKPGGVQWWMGPDETPGYILCMPIPTGDSPTPVGNIGTVTFIRSEQLTDNSFLSLINYLSAGSVTTSDQISSWLATNGFWSSWNAPAPPVLTTLIGAGVNSSFVLFGGKLWSWGFNAAGQLGNNSLLYQSTPVAVCGDHTFFSISSGNNHSFGIDNYGKAWGWGYNLDGSLGNNNSCNNNSVLEKILTPVAVCGNHTFCSIAVSESNSVGMDNYGKVWGWGYNVYGSLGDNSIINQSTPVAVCGNHTFCSIYGGGMHTFGGIDNYGKVWGWGYNGYGSLGDNSTISQSTPVAVCGNHTFCSISAGNNHLLCIDNYSKAWGWGYNEWGQLGDNSITPRSTPIAVYGNKTFCSISAAQRYSLGIDNYGKVWSWGLNQFGGLGDNSTISQSTPVAVCGNHTFCSISAGNSSLGIDNYDHIWGWGYNQFGQLGDNSIIDKYTPVRVCNF